ncbi:MAG TPA: hypothetical protein VJK50_04830 [Patescibacteria group bacterium]|nr:hypothetical protein [Patescibacteria group bacterium]
MKRLVVVLLLLLGFVKVAEAQITVVPLKHGMTVWGILKDQGCSAKEVVPLWPLVFKDSGLRLEDERHLLDDTPITIKRDCTGQLRGGDEDRQAFQIQIAALNEELRVARVENGKNTAAMKVLEEEALSSRSRAIWWRGICALLFLVAVVLLWALIMSQRELRRWEKQSQEWKTDMLRSAEQHLQLPRQVTVKQWGEDYVFELKEDPEAMMRSYICPDCGEELFTPVECEPHLRKEHPSSGQVTSVVGKKP